MKYIDLDSKSFEFGLLYEAGLSLSEIGRRYGISRQRVHQKMPKDTTRRKWARIIPWWERLERREKDKIAHEIASVLHDWSALQVYKVLYGVYLPPKTHGESKTRRGRPRITRGEEIVTLWQSGMNFSDIRSLLGCSKSTIGVRLSDARKRGEIVRYARPGNETRMKDRGIK